MHESRIQVSTLLSYFIQLITHRAKVDKSEYVLLMKFFHGITKNEFFAPDGSALRAVKDAMHKRQRRSELANSAVIPKKRSKVVFEDTAYNTLEEFAHAAASATRDEDIDTILRNSR